MTAKLKVALVYNLKRKVEDNSLPPDYYSEFDSEDTINAIADVLRRGGNDVFLVEADRGLLDWLRDNNVDIAFNLAEGLNGESRESQVPAILDFLNIPYTGSGVLALSVALDKTLTKKLLEQAGIPTPKYSSFMAPEEVSDDGLAYPLIVKPNSEGSAKGISISSVVRDRQGLVREAERTHRVYNQGILVEEFIEGRELTVGILGNGSPSILPILEIDFSSCKSSGEFFYTWRVKEYEKEVEEEQGLSPIWHCPARLSEGQSRAVADAALKAYRVVGCRDMSRVDIRLSVDDIPYVLEVNPLPGLDPKDSNFPYIAKCAGLSYAELMNKILELAWQRHKSKNSNLTLIEERSLS